MLLGVETSSDVGSLALLRPDGSLRDYSLESAGRRHAQALVPAAHELLSEEKLTVADLTGVAVSCGPGSFTGLRVGIVFAKTLAWVNRLPLFAVPTFSACALQAADDEKHTGKELVCLCDAQRQEVFLQRHTVTGGTPEELTVRPEAEIEIRPVAQLTPEDFRPKTGAVTACGPGAIRFGDELRQAGWTTGPEDLLMPRAATICRVAAQLRTRNKTSDPATLEPIYIRRSYAEEKRRH